MKFIKTSIEDVFIIEPEIFEDERGFFFEEYSKNKFNNNAGKYIEFVQQNCSQSKKGVIRGLHYQLEPYAQGKLVSCLDGEIFDVLVDLRKDSKTFGQWIGEVLSSTNKRQLWIPAGFAHGFLTLSSSAKIFYKVTNYYMPTYERVIKWNDPIIGIKWPFINNIKLSGKDENGLSFLEVSEND